MVLEGEAREAVHAHPLLPLVAEEAVAPHQFTVEALHHGAGIGVLHLGHHLTGKILPLHTGRLQQLAQVVGEAANPLFDHRLGPIREIVPRERRTRLPPSSLILG